jgi:myo-inositol-1(or 4)-monophosphatase
VEPEARPEFRAETLAAIAALGTALPVAQSREGAGDVREKGPGDIVTATDLRVQVLLETQLRAACPDVAFVGEEGEAATPGAHQPYWLVDPICGTANYAAGIPLWAINIALVEDGQVTCATVADGSTGEALVAERGHGAWRLAPSGAVRTRASATTRLLSVDPHSLGRDDLARFGPEFARAAIGDPRWDVRVLSSTLALAYVATGRLAAAVYATLGSPVHFAAGLLLAEEAGAVVTDEHGQPYRLDAGIHVLAADATLHAYLRSRVTAVLATIKANAG